MNYPEKFIAFQTILVKEIRRFLRIWVQTILPPAITMTLYFIVFGHFIGQRIGTMGNFSYIEYIVPGLIMMSVATNAYANVVSSFFSAKFQRNIEEMLVSPMPNYIILSGYVIGGVARGLAVGLVTAIVSLFFTHLHVAHIGLSILVILLTAILFSLGGFINGVFATKFDDTSIVPTFILTPLIYLGGVFYSIHMLPEIWQQLSLYNPILYMINAFRYGILGVADVDISLAISLLIGLSLGLYAWGLYLLNRGTGLRV